MLKSELILMAECDENCLPKSPPNPVVEHPLVLRVTTWNCLADCYHEKEDFVVRKELLRRVVASCRADILLMQEVDHWDDFYEPSLRELGYHSIYYQRPGRWDGLSISCLGSCGVVLDEIDKINLDDLAHRMQDTTLLRSNIGLLCRFKVRKEDEYRYGKKKLVVGNTHIYWNPSRPDIKLAQAAYIVERVDAFTMPSISSTTTFPCAVILGGDFNSKPDSVVYAKMLSGMDVQRTLPLCGPGTRFLCDVTLIKLCKWLRLLGVDAKMEPEESIALRTCEKQKEVKSNGQKGHKKGILSNSTFSPLFDLARSERRVILTSSQSLRTRSNCPQSHLVQTRNFEKALIEVVNIFQLDIQETQFLTVCGKCGGKIETLESVKKELAASGRATEGTSLESSTTFMPLDRPVFACTMCLQAYWWNDRSDSSPARAMRVAKKLFELIQSHNDNDGSDIDDIDEISGKESKKGKRGEEKGEVGGEERRGEKQKQKQKQEWNQGIGKGKSKGKPTSMEGTGPYANMNGKVNMPASIYATGLPLVDIKDETALAKHVYELNSLFQTRDETLLRTMEAENLPKEQSESVVKVTSTPFVSAYAAAHSREPKFTNWNEGFRETLDYIFVRGACRVSHAEVVPHMHANDTSGSDSGCEGKINEVFEGARAKTASEDEPTTLAITTWTVESRSQPSEEWPSDHLMVCCNIVI